MRNRNFFDKGLSKLLMGFTSRSKYPGFIFVGALLSAIGCVHAPNMISLSTDGRHAAVVVNGRAEGVLHGDEGGDLAVVMIDTNKRDARAVGTGIGFDDFAFISNDSKRVAFMVPPKNDTSRYDTYITDGEKVTHLENSALPLLIGDLGWLSYSQRLEKRGEGVPNLSAKMRNLKDGTEYDLGINGFVTGVSPDYRHLSFLEIVGSDDKKYLDYRLGICDINGENKKMISYVHLEGISLPKWVSNTNFLFQTIPGKTGDSEIVIGDILGGLEIVTTNDFNELYPQMVNGRVYYAQHENGQMFPIYEARKSGDSWESRDLGLKTKDSFRVVGERGDQVIYIGRNNHLYLGDLDDGNERSPLDVTNLLKMKYSATGNE